MQPTTVCSERIAQYTVFLRVGTRVSSKKSKGEGKDQ